jgi:hypothetical protein
MQIIDDRTEEQKLTHTVLIVAYDSFMSNWKDHHVKKSFCAWACKPEHQDQVFEWVFNRMDMHQVRPQEGDYVPLLGPDDHYQIYVVNDGHRALKNPD